MTSGWGREHAPIETFDFDSVFESACRCIPQAIGFEAELCRALRASAEIQKYFNNSGLTFGILRQFGFDLSFDFNLRQNGKLRNSQDLWWGEHFVLDKLLEASILLLGSFYRVGQNTLIELKLFNDR